MRAVETQIEPTQYMYERNMKSLPVSDGWNINYLHVRKN